MVDLLARLAGDFQTFAPELVAEPKACLYRIYRDTRFSDDKRPLKTHVAAHFPMRGMRRGTGAGLYLEIAPRWVWMGGGIYMPDAEALRAIRAKLAVDHRRFRRLAQAPAFTRLMGELTGDQLTRVPRGYAADHPAADLLRYKQFLAGREREAAFAVHPRFYKELLDVFKATAPLVRFFNEAIADGGTAPAVLTSGPERRSSTTRAHPSHRSIRPEPMW
jgi:uncharacterized protein (TIGR02453 family)